METGTSKGMFGNYVEKITGLHATLERVLSAVKGSEAENGRWVEVSGGDGRKKLVADDGRAYDLIIERDNSGHTFGSGGQNETRTIMEYNGRKIFGSSHFTSYATTSDDFFDYSGADDCTAYLLEEDSVGRAVFDKLKGERSRLLNWASYFGFKKAGVGKEDFSNWMHIRAPVMVWDNFGREGGNKITLKSLCGQKYSKDEAKKAWRTKKDPTLHNRVICHRCEREHIRDNYFTDSMRGVEKERKRVAEEEAKLSVDERIKKRIAERRTNFSDYQWECGCKGVYDKIKTYDDLKKFMLVDDANTRIFVMSNIIMELADALPEEQRKELFYIAKGLLSDGRMCDIGYSTSYADEEDDSTVCGTAKAAMHSLALGESRA